MPDDRLHHHVALGRQGYLAHRHPSWRKRHPGWGIARAGAGKLTGLTNGYAAHTARRRRRRTA